MSIGDEFAFPVPASLQDGSSELHGCSLGMSYRQWLIGQAIAAGHLLDEAIEAADEIIDMLDAEPTRKRGKT